MLYRYLLALWLWICIYSCQSHEQDVSQLVTDSCSSHPITFYLAEQERAEKIYQFGESHQDQDFRQLINELLLDYQRTGQDIDLQTRTDIARKYAPNYLQRCESFFALAVQTCSHLNPSEAKFSTCLEPYNEAFQKQLDQQVLLSGQELVNIEGLNFELPENLATQVESKKSPPPAKTSEP